MKKLIFTAILILLICSTNTSSSYASDIGLGVYPPLIKAHADKPSSIRLPLKVKNMGDEPIEVNVSIRALNATRDGSPELILFKDYTPEFTALVEAINIIENDQNVSTLTFSPEETKELKLNIEISKEQKEKDYYFSVIFQIANKEQDENSHSLIQASTAANVLLSVGRTDPSYEADLTSSPLTFGGNLKFKSSISNTGSSFLTFRPQISIENIFGKSIEVINFKEQNVLAGQSKRLYNDLSEANIVSKNKYILGPYKARLMLNMEGKETISEKIIFLFVIPDWSLWTLSIGGVVLSLIIKRIIVRRKRLRT